MQATALCSMHGGRPPPLGGAGLQDTPHNSLLDPGAAEATLLLEACGAACSGAGCSVGLNAKSGPHKRPGSHVVLNDKHRQGGLPGLRVMKYCRNQTGAAEHLIAIAKAFLEGGRIVVEPIQSTRTYRVFSKTMTCRLSLHFRLR